jgi:hypothetical protein
MTIPSNYPIDAWRLRLAGKALITYDQMNWLRAKPQSGPKPQVIQTLKDIPGYPYPSSTNQRRRPWRLQGHRGVGAKSVNILQNGAPEKDGSGGFRISKLQVGVWRGAERRLLKALGSKYDGQQLRVIRATKGVGRPWVTLLPSDPQPSTSAV